LIGETEFVVPQGCNFNLNRLIQRDILGDGPGVSYRAIAIFVVFMRSGTRRSPSLERTNTPLHLATVMVSPPAPVRWVPSRCPQDVFDLAADEHRVDQY
jgi:hypothetical protein